MSLSIAKHLHRKNERKPPRAVFEYAKPTLAGTTYENDKRDILR